MTDTSGAADERGGMADSSGGEADALGGAADCSGGETGDTGSTGDAHGTGSTRRVGGSRFVPLGRRQVLGTASIGLGASLAGCIDVLEAGRGGGTEEPIRIGVLAPDPARDPVGSSMVRAVELWADQRNEAGGLLGRDIEVAVENTKASPLEGRRAYQRLVLDEDVDVTTGIFETTTLDTVIHEIAEHETLHFTTGSTSSTPTNLIGADNPYRFHFRVMLNDLQIVNSQFAFLADMASEMGWESAAVLTEDYPWASGLADVYSGQDSLGPDGPPTSYLNHYPPETDDFTEIYDEVEATGADAAWVGMAHTGDDAVIQWAEQQREFAFGGIHVPMQLPRYYEMVDGACRYGITQTSATASANLPDLKDEFVADYQDRYDDLPVYTGYNSFNSMLVYEATVEEAGTTDSAELVETLRGEKTDGEFVVETTSGSYSFYDHEGRFPHDPVTEYGSPEGAGAIFFQWQEDEQGNGYQEAIWPEHAASGDYVDPHWV